MGSKLQPGDFDCYGAALPDEPMFVLLARDRSAPAMLRSWSDTRRKQVLAKHDAGDITADEMEGDLRKCSEADACADGMTVWRKRNEGMWRAGAEHRHRIAEASADELLLIETAVISAIGGACAIPSQFHSGAMTIAAHHHRLLLSPLFSGRRHHVTLATQGRFDMLDKDQALATDRYPVQGMYVADIDIFDHSADRLVLDLVVIVDG